MRRHRSPVAASASDSAPPHRVAAERAIAANTDGFVRRTEVSRIEDGSDGGAADSQLKEPTHASYPDALSAKTSLAWEPDAVALNRSTPFAPLDFAVNASFRSHVSG